LFFLSATCGFGATVSSQGIPTILGIAEAGTAAKTKNTLALKKFAKVVTAFTGQVACKETRTFGKGGRSADEYIQHPKT
jgi:hypothetical protein